MQRPRRQRGHGPGAARRLGIGRLITLPLRALIHVYRWTLSPLLGAMGAQCRFHPTCSAYALEALQRHGLRGVPMSVGRVLRCHPWNEGGLDPVPDGPRREEAE